MKPYPFMPGVPAAGHISSRGFWHPGSADNCHRCPGECDHQYCSRDAVRTVKDEHYCHEHAREAEKALGDHY
jgi:hypothetical protein